MQQLQLPGTVLLPTRDPPGVVKWRLQSPGFIVSRSGQSTQYALFDAGIATRVVSFTEQELYRPVALRACCDLSRVWHARRYQHDGVSPVAHAVQRTPE